jgi:hypothetical protein
LSLEFDVRPGMAEFRDGAKAGEETTKASELTNWKKAHYVETLAAAKRLFIRFYREWESFRFLMKFQLFCTASSDNRLYAWDIARDKPIFRAEHNKHGKRIAVSVPPVVRHDRESSSNRSFSPNPGGIKFVQHACPQARQNILKANTWEREQKGLRFISVHSSQSP